MIKFVNLTPHPIRLRPNAANMAASPDAADIVVAPFAGTDGKPAPARVSSTPGRKIADVDTGGIPLYSAPHWGEVEGVPARRPGTVYIVSLMVLEAFRRRGLFRLDVCGPGTGPTDGAVRYGDDAGPRKGQVFAVTRLNAV